MDRFTKGSIIVGLILAVIAIPISINAKIPRETVTLNKITVKFDGWTRKKRIYTDKDVNVIIVNEGNQGTNSITISDKEGNVIAYFNGNESRYVLCGEADYTFDYVIEKVRKRIKK